jgi:hypothetical protein
MTTEETPAPPPRRRLPIDRIIVLVIGIALVSTVWIMKGTGNLVTGFRDEVAVAEAGVTNVVAALVTITDDAGVTNVREILTDPNGLDRESMRETVLSHSDAAYQLLRMGSRSRLDLKPHARAALYQGYIDLGTDPWGQQFYVYFGPLASQRDDETAALWEFDGAPGESASADDPPPLVAWPGAHKDGSEPRAVPAPAGLPFYVICAGPNGRLDQPFMNGGEIPAEGDDITSWDGYAWEVVRGNRE